MPHIVKLFALLFLSILCGVQAAIAARSAPIVGGWNLVGNSSRDAIDVPTFFSNSAVYNAIWTFDSTAGKWSLYSPELTTDDLFKYTQSRGFGVLKTIKPQQGFWVNAKTNGVIDLPATPAEGLSAAELSLGFNLVAISSALRPIEQIFEMNKKFFAAGKEIVTIWGWDAASSTWKFYSETLAKQGGAALFDYIRAHNARYFAEKISPNEGIWLNIKQIIPANNTLTGTWLLDEISDKEGISSNLAALKLSITFTQIKTFSGFAGCNGFSGKYTSDTPTDLRPDYIRSTLISCSDKDFMEIRFLSNLGSARSFTSNNGVLNLLDDTSKTILRFKLQ